MTTEELLGQLYDETLTGNKPAVLELTNAGLALGLGPETLLYEALIPSLEEVGARFERGDFFVPEMLIAGKAMAGALAGWATACTVPRVATSLLSWASTVLTWFRVRKTFSSVSLPAPALLMVIMYGPPTRRPRAIRSWPSSGARP